MRLDQRPIVVIKLGGSLLDWSEWPARLGRYLAGRAEVAPVVVVGGGRFADVLRDLDGTHRLGEDRAHALALRVLDTTAQLAAALLPGGVVVQDRAGVVAAQRAGQIPIFAPRLFLDHDDWTAADPLPHAWTTTTDSIAARIAHRLEAVELVLLKSCPRPIDCTDWAAAARLGLVDPEFPLAVAQVPKVSMICLKDEPSQPTARSRL